VTLDRTDRRLWTAAVVLAVIGLGVAAYLTYIHYEGIKPVCGLGGNCEKVQTSDWSKLAGIPVALLGLAFFIGMTSLSVPPMWRTSSPWPGRLRLVGVLTGVVFVCYLIWAELFQINAICLWCTVVHALTLVLFALVIIRLALVPPAS